MTRVRIVVVDCPRCEAKVNAEVIATEMVGDADIQMPSHRISFVRCPGCHQTLLTREEFEGQSNSWGEDEYVFGSPSRLWPTPDRQAHSAVPPIVQVSLDEAYRCHRAGAHTACAVMCGRALEGVCVHFGLKNMLAKGLGELRTRGLIDERLFKWGEQLRKHRNAAAHATGDKVSREDSTDLLEFVAAICDYIFVLTARFDAFMARKEVATASVIAVAAAAPVLAAGTTDSDA